MYSKSRQSISSNIICLPEIDVIHRNRYVNNKKSANTIIFLVKPIEKNIYFVKKNQVYLIFLMLRQSVFFSS